MTAIVIDDEEVMTDEEWKIFVEIEVLKAELDNARQRARLDIAQFMQRPALQNALAKLEPLG